MLQKQKTPGAPDEDIKSKVTDDPTLKGAADKAKDVLAKLDEQSKKKKGHYEECCGVRYWVED